jgi:Fic family protein
VIEKLLIDLSRSSSRLEGNRCSLLVTEDLCKDDISTGDIDAAMLFNHKAAMEYLVDVVSSQGMTLSLISNLHVVLMRGLLASEAV